MSTCTFRPDLSDQVWSSGFSPSSARIPPATFGSHAQRLKPEFQTLYVNMYVSPRSQRSGLEFGLQPVKRSNSTRHIWISRPAAKAGIPNPVCQHVRFAQISAIRFGVRASARQALEFHPPHLDLTPSG